ncbi:MAG: ABC transporter ATP-binding protein [Candidatus Heimdallarchaeota archaeon]|nr:ABC transporter ATP-binding protein [Candidatus Heimdallarchaeota archaeon]
MIEFQNVIFGYEKTSEKALQDISLKIGKSEFVAIVGKNGAGKTTLIKHINGLLKPNSGIVKINDENIFKEPISKMATIVGIAFQNPNHQLFATTVKEELEFGPKNLGRKKEEREEIALTISKKFQIEHLLERSPLELSGGERKLVSIASVLTMNQKVLVLDEPTYGQDYRQKKRLGLFLKELSQSGITIVIVSHDVDFILDFVQRTIVMNNGKIIADGSTKEIFTNKTLVEEADLAVPVLIELSNSLRILNNNFPLALEENLVFENITRYFFASKNIGKEQ